MLWVLAIPVALEANDYIQERQVRMSIQQQVNAHFRDTNGRAQPGRIELDRVVLVLNQLPDGRYILHARDKDKDGARSSEAVREYFYDPTTGKLTNRTLRQTFRWKANLRH